MLVVPPRRSPAPEVLCAVVPTAWRCPRPACRPAPSMLTARFPSDQAGQRDRPAFKRRLGELTRALAISNDKADLKTLAVERLKRKLEVFFLCSCRVCQSVSTNWAVGTMLSRLTVEEYRCACNSNFKCVVLTKYLRTMLLAVFFLRVILLPLLSPTSRSAGEESQLYQPLTSKTLPNGGSRSG